MGILDNPLFGTPQASDSTGEEVVKAREFDITQYGKKMAVLIGVLVPAIVGALKLFHVKEISDAMVIAALAVTAVGILSASFVMAVDMIARALVTRQTGGDGEKKSAPSGATGAAGGGPAPTGPGSSPGTQFVRIKGSDDPRPVFAVRDEGGDDSAFLVPIGAKLSDPPGFEGPLRWVPAKKVRASVSRA